MSADEAGGPPPKMPDDMLPNVEPPTAGFILQLFLIPLLIVSIVILLWLLFSWLAQSGQNDPKTVLDDLKRMRNNSWQRAYEFVSLISAKDERGEALRHDPKVAAEVSDLLVNDIKGASGEIDSARGKLRMYLCRALGNFQIPEVFPALVIALEHDACLEDVQVRIGAAESLAILANQLGPENVRDRPDVMKALIAAATREDRTEEIDDAQAKKIIEADPRLGSEYRPHAELRAVAAYALGVIGGEEAANKLYAMTQNDPYASARYNAATGLARQGDERVIETLLEMLDPKNEAPAAGEWNKKEKEQQRLNVMRAGMQGALRLAQADPKLDLSRLKEALQRLSDDELPEIEDAAGKRKIRLQAAETLDLMKETKADGKQSAVPREPRKSLVFRLAVR